MSWLTISQLRAGGVVDYTYQPSDPVHVGGTDLLEHYTSLGAHDLTLPANKYSAIPWDKEYSGSGNLGHPGIVWGHVPYEAKATFKVDGLASN